MPLYMGTKDVQLINSLNEEIINNIIDTVVSIFKLKLYETNENLYNEAIDKVWHPGVQVAGLIEHDNQSFESSEFGPDVVQSVTFNFHRNTLEDINLYPEVGDIIEYNSNQYEVDEVIENQFLAGQTNLNHSIICNTHLTRKTTTKLEKIKRIYDSDVESLYRD